MDDEVCVIHAFTIYSRTEGISNFEAFDLKCDVKFTSDISRYPIPLPVVTLRALDQYYQLSNIHPFMLA